MEQHPVTGPRWLQVTVTLPTGGTDAMTNFLMELGAQGVAIQDAETLRDPLRRVPDHREQIVAHYPLSEESQAARGEPQEGFHDAQDLRDQIDAYTAQLMEMGELTGAAQVQVETIMDPGWAEAWKAHYRVLHPTPRLVVRPVWEPYQAAPGEVVLSLDPGQAFGTGNHATTLLCLQALDRLFLQSGPSIRSVLDAGAGSGILAIAAALLGAETITAMDHDPLSVEACHQNARLNGVVDGLKVMQVDLLAEQIPKDQGPYDLIVANIQTDILAPMAKSLVGAMAPQGWLILSGILHHEQEPLKGKYLDEGLDLQWDDLLTMDSSWCAMVFRRSIKTGPPPQQPSTS